MTFATLSQSLVQLRGFICAGAETLVTLQFLDRLLHKLSITSQHQSYPTHDASIALKKANKISKALRKQNEKANEVILSMRADLDMMTIKSRRLQEEVLKFQYGQQREDRKSHRKANQNTTEMEVQCEILSPLLFDRNYELFQNQRRDNQNLRMQIQHLEDTLIQLNGDLNDDQSTIHDENSQGQVDDSFEENPQDSLPISRWQFKSLEKETPFEDKSNDIVNRVLLKASSLFSKFLKSQ